MRDREIDPVEKVDQNAKTEEPRDAPSAPRHMFFVAGHSIWQQFANPIFLWDEVRSDYTNTWLDWSSLRCKRIWCNSPSRFAFDNRTYNQAADPNRNVPYSRFSRGSHSARNTHESRIAILRANQL